MHLTLKKETTKPAAANTLQQQARFDAFVTRFNQERPHQALGRKVPADLYTRSPRVYRGLEDLTYPFHDQTITVTHCGRICFKGRKVNLSHVFAGENVGVTQVGERIWLVTFMHYDLGYFDDETCRLEPIANPFGPKVLPMSPAGMNCHPCVRNGPGSSGAPCRTRTCDLLVRSQTLYPTELRARRAATPGTRRLHTGHQSRQSKHKF
jgi:hypothetical protein